MPKDTKHREPAEFRAEPAFGLDAGLFRSAIEQAAVAIGICDLDGRYLYVNPKFAGLLGYTAAGGLRTAL
jgi:PAS domain-containing protein